MGPIPYEGTEKYIFISYAHKDSDRVMPILEKLVENGYRVWYDDGITPGSEWPEFIAQHLDKCAAFMPFVSPNSMASENCRREINFAIARNKPVLTIILEPTEMPLGMELQLTSQHCVTRNDYFDEEDFLYKLFSSVELAQCNVTPATILQKGKEYTGKRVGLKNREKKKSRGGKILATLFVLLLLAVAAAGGMFLKSYVTILPEVQVSRYTLSLSLREQQITAEAVENLKQLEQLETLYFYDCTIDEGVLQGLQSSTLKVLHMENTPVTDLTFLNSCPSVYNLILINCNVSNKTFKDVETGNITQVTLSDNPDFSDLKVFTAPGLRVVNADHTGVSSVAHLAGFAQLNEVNCSATKVTKIDALAPLENLTVLNFSECAISKVSEPFQSKFLHTVDLGGCGLKSLSGFENITTLKKVYLHGNQLKKVDWLEKSLGTLTDLNLSGNPLNKEALWFLREAGRLTYIDVSGIPLGDAELFSKMTELMGLYAVNCGITDLTRMSGLENLEDVHLSHNKITDLTGLPGFNQMEPARLDLAYNKIESIAPIEGYRFGVLALQGNPISYEAGDFDGLRGELVTLDYHESLHNSGKVSFSRVYVAGCPLDKQLALEDTVGYGLACVTEDMMLEVLKQNYVEYYVE